MLIGEGQSVCGGSDRGRQAVARGPSKFPFSLLQRPYSCGGPVPANPSIALSIVLSIVEGPPFDSTQGCLSRIDEAPKPVIVTEEDSQLMANADNGVATSDTQAGVQPGAPG